MATTVIYEKFLVVEQRVKTPCRNRKGSTPEAPFPPKDKWPYEYGSMGTGIKRPSGVWNAYSDSAERSEYSSRGK